MDESVATTKPKKSKLEYSDEEPEIEVANTSTPTDVIRPPSVKKARSDAQKAATARMRIKLDERRKVLIVIKQEAKETALLQQIEFQQQTL